jgi:hypothetical protein
MTTPMIRIHNSQTGEIIDREMNAEELAEAAVAKAQGDALTAAVAKAEADKAALLAKLGITADEAKLLLS